MKMIDTLRRAVINANAMIHSLATIDGSLTTIPLPRAYTQVLAVPRSIARSLENRENNDRKLNRDSS